MTIEEKRQILSRKEQISKGNKIRAELDACRTGEETLGFLYRNVKRKDILDRMKNVKDMKELRNYDATQARVRMSMGTQRNQDIVNAAAQKYCELTGTDTKEFRKTVDKYLQKQDMTRTQLYALRRSR